MIQRRVAMADGMRVESLAGDWRSLDDDGRAFLARALGESAQRFRANLFRQSGFAAAIRIVPSRIPSLESLGLPPRVARFADLGSGLVLVTGPTGSGKSTTLAALIERVNRTRPAHVVTIEDPVGYRYTPDQALIQQREIGSDTESFATALRQAHRQDPDVILIGELRDPETFDQSLARLVRQHVLDVAVARGAADNVSAFDTKVRG
jgi:twitching motility protein PilT